jgi:hypothetical protein
VNVSTASEHSVSRPAVSVHCGKTLPNPPRLPSPPTPTTPPGSPTSPPLPALPFLCVNSTPRPRRPTPPMPTPRPPSTHVDPLPAVSQATTVVTHVQPPACTRVLQSVSVNIDTTAQVPPPSCDTRPAGTGHRRIGLLKNNNRGYSKWASRRSDHIVMLSPKVSATSKTTRPSHKYKTEMKVALEIDASSVLLALQDNNKVFK